MERSVETGVLMLRRAAAAKKCHQCGCLRQVVASIKAGLSAESITSELRGALEEAESVLIPQRYDCLGCNECYPSVALSALGVEEAACPVDVAAPREGWPPLPGSYSALRYTAPVAVCALTTDHLSSRIASAK